MLSGKNPVEVLTTLRTAERLLREQAERLYRHAAASADFGDWAPTRRHAELVQAAEDLAALADAIAAGAEQ